MVELVHAVEQRGSFFSPDDVAARYEALTSER